MIEETITIRQRYHGDGPFARIDSVEVEISCSDRVVYRSRMEHRLWQKDESPPKKFLDWLFTQAGNKSKAGGDVGCNSCKRKCFFRKVLGKLFHLKVKFFQRKL